MIPPIPKGWHRLLRNEIDEPYFHELDAFLEREAAEHVVHPHREEIFKALDLTPHRAVKALLLGQDPYPNPGQAHGLAFSVRPGVKPPPSLRNIFKELKADLGMPPPNHGYLAAWARRGVLLLNAVLTVREGRANSHRGRGWERFTDRVISAVNGKRGRVVFVLWGAHAQKKIELIDTSKHAIVTGAHPSPLSARHGFFGTRPFSRVNQALEAAGIAPVDWRLPDLES